MQSELKKKHKKFFDLARKLSKKSEYHHQLGAVVVKKGKVIGIGFNKPNKTHPKSNHPFKTIHAEFDAMWGASKEDLAGATIYIYRDDAKEEPAMAKPCKYCESLIRLAGLETICYTTNGNYKEEIVNV